MAIFDNRRLFDLAAWGYDFITRQDIWRDQIGRTLDFLDVDHTPVRILDLGCGPGISTFVLAELLPDASVIGVDISGKMIARANSHHTRTHGHLSNLEFHQANVYDLPFDEGSFDLAIGHSFLYLLPHQQQALSAIRTVLTDGGRLVLLEPNAEGSLPLAARRAPMSPFFSTPIAATRFATSMLFWRIVSRSRGQMTTADLKMLFTTAGLHDVVVNPTLNSLGLHVTGRR